MQVGWTNVSATEVQIDIACNGQSQSAVAEDQAELLGSGPQPLVLRGLAGRLHQQATVDAYTDTNEYAAQHTDADANRHQFSDEYADVDTDADEHARQHTDQHVHSDSDAHAYGNHNADAVRWAL